MKLIISESQAISLGEIDWVKNKIGKMALNNPGIAKSVGISTDPMDSLSPEMKEKLRTLTLKRMLRIFISFYRELKMLVTKKHF